MGYKSKNKQGPPRPLAGSDMDPKQKSGGKKRGRNYGKADAKTIKQKGGAAKSDKERQKQIKQRVKKIDQVEEDSDLDEALQPG